MTQTLLEQGIGAARAGRRDEARHLLTQAVEADAHNEQGWLWLAGLVSDPEDMRTCLENVLHLNPDNGKALAGLAWVEQRYGPRPDEVSHTPPSAPALAAPPTKQAPVAPPKDPARAAPPAVLATSPAGEAAGATPEAYPCFYCGAPAALEQRDCPRCHGSLMIRAAPREKRSVPLTILGILWILPGVFQILGGLAATVMASLAYSTLQRSLPRVRGVAATSFPLQLLLPLAAGVVFGAMSIGIGRGLLKRRRLSYLIVIFFAALGLTGAIAMLIMGAAAVPKIAQAIGSPALSARDASLARVGAGAMMTAFTVSIGWQLIYTLLVALSYRDFFGPMVRFQPELDEGDDMASYNSGVAYKNRGMWFMAAQEWLVAVKKRPGDGEYLHALGLAYVQLKKCYPKSEAYHQGIGDFLRARKADLYTAAPELEKLDLL